MSALAPTLQAFFTDRLVRQRHASPETVAAYRDGLRLLVGFASQVARKAPSQLDIADLDATVIASFLDHLEHQRRNSVRTRNARLAAIHSLYRYAALRHPEHAELIQRVLAIPSKRCDRALISFLTRQEVATLIATPDRSTWTGRRDHALLQLAIQTGLRASELLRLTRGDLHLGTGPHVGCRGKGRKNRITPLIASTVATLRTWLAERGGTPTDPLFPTRRGRALSRDAFGTPARKLRRHRYARMPVIANQTDLGPRPPAHCRHAVTAGRRRYLRNRALARPRERRDDANLPPRRLASQRTSPCAHAPANNKAWPLPALRLPAGLPGGPVIMPIFSAPSELGTGPVSA